MPKVPALEIVFPEQGGRIWITLYYDEGKYDD